MPFPVMDAFKNFIRHGKHARTSAPVTKETHIHAQPVPVSSSPKSARRQEVPQHIDLGDARSNAKPTQGQDGGITFTNQPQVQTPYTKEVEMIVQEERQAKSKMPVYKGLEQFKLVEKMGDGAFSNVYKAIDLTTGKKVAIKVVRKYELNSTQEGNKHLNPQFKKKPRVTERANILKEVQIMRGMQHPSIVKLISFSESDEHYHLVLELMEGGELFHQIVKLTYFSEHLSRHVILQVAQGIRHLHEERGVVHRDIKPENILFERIPIIPSKQPISRPYEEEKEDEGEFIEGVGGGGIGRVKIADFGLSKIVWNEETQTPCGTVGYTAPEIVKDERYSKSVDMWALGCVLYTLLCGFPPFYDESINVLTEKVARGYYTFLSPWWDHISLSAKDLITHLLCVDPAERYTIDEFLAHPWCNEPIGITMPPPIPPTPSLPMDSPLLSTARGVRNAEGRSPGVATLKEAFDVTYAVHRMEEEGARRRAYNGQGGAGARGFLTGLNEEEEEEEDAVVVEEVAKKHGKQAGAALEEEMNKQRSRLVQDDGHAYANAAPGTGNRKAAEATIADGRAGIRDQGRTVRKQRQAPATNGFSLDLNNATLLGRRHRRAVDPSPLGQYGHGASPNTPRQMYRQMDPGSPMQVV